MINFKRGLNPLTPEEEKKLGEWWEEKYSKSKKSSDWSWKGKGKIIQSALLKCNNDHCAYCDCHLLKDDRGFEIDHFKPKTTFLLDAFTYSNLFPCCRECNKRGNKYDTLLLKPDETNFQFEEYFRYDSRTGKILPNELKSVENQKRAEITIKIFNLNSGSKPLNRFNAIKKEVAYNTPFDERPYRYGY
ncbi:retron system putative HNH endonuclease [Emticicia agri]|uniref:TIGR02646 family protein n=1 Tax=Emticicia agri TaxID=2492393 RepID=A0A4Q5M3B3_9BACT|nr:retron system putative HNH endonuclease [Emticicia agri]RYU96549.1 TIGR02646 family protein [Emticicia agri]